MSDRAHWAALRERRMSEPGAEQAFHAAKLAFELGREVRALRQRAGWSQTQLARTVGMAQSPVARFEAGGTIPSLPVLDRLAEALNADLTVTVMPRAGVA